MRVKRIFIILFLCLFLTGCSLTSGNTFESEEVVSYLSSLDGCLEGDCLLDGRITLVDSDLSSKYGRDTVEYIYQIDNTDITFRAYSLCINDELLSFTCTYGITSFYYNDVMEYVTTKFKNESGVSDKYLKTYYNLCTDNFAHKEILKCNHPVVSKFYINKYYDGEVISSYVMSYIDYLNDYKSTIDFNFINTGEVRIGTKKTPSIIFNIVLVDGKYYLNYHDKDTDKDIIVNHDLLSSMLKDYVDESFTDY